MSEYPGARSLARISITLKMLAGYLLVAAFFVSVSAYALYSLNRLRRGGDEESVRQLDLLLSVQQLKVDQAVLELSSLDFLDSADVRQLAVFRSRLEQFDRALQDLARVPGSAAVVDEIVSEYRHYLDVFAEAQNQLRHGGGSPAGGVERVRLQARRLSSALDALVASTRIEVEERFRIADRINRRASDQILALTLVGLVAGLVPILLAAARFRSSLRELNRATQMIAEGAFDYEPQVREVDETGELANGLRAMAQKFKNYEQMCLDASPLTRLPGNIAIERALLERIRRGEKFALCYADLDDFKAYNDTFGYAKGSEIIKVTGEILHEAKRRFGRGEDFVGHIGGDDFVLITAPENISAVCENIIQEFDRVIPFFYHQEDRERGYIEAVDRYGIARKFPIMTISIAVVSDSSRELLAPTEIAKVAAEIKEFVKKLPGSNYLVDRRRGTRPVPVGGEPPGEGS